MGYSNHPPPHPGGVLSQLLSGTHGVGRGRPDGDADDGLVGLDFRATRAGHFDGAIGPRWFWSRCACERALAGTPCEDRESREADRQEGSSSHDTLRTVWSGQVSRGGYNGDFTFQGC